MGNEKRGRGRPTKFEDRLIGKIEVLAKEGKTNLQIAEIIGINPDTLYVWISKYRELAEALKSGKSIADDLVEASLFRRAIGYSHKSVETFFDARSKSVIEHPIIKHYAPDTGAAIFWLKNRRPEQWRENSQATNDVEKTEHTYETEWGNASETTNTTGEDDKE